MQLLHLNKSSVEIELKLSAFKTFIDLAGNELTSDDFEIVLSLLFFSCSFGHDPGIWVTTAIPRLLGMRTTTLSMGV
ncbi:hypothetical protein TB2_042455 [Malus domestica]